MLEKRININTVMKRFDAATDLLNGAVSMEAISANFAKNHAKLSPGHIYFLNRQLLGKGKKLTNEAEGGRSFYDVLNATIEDDDIHLFLFIDEAHIIGSIVLGNEAYKPLFWI